MQFIHTNKTKHQLASQLGFTMLELLVVIMLLGVISTVAILAYDKVPDESREDITKYEMQALKKALLLFRAHNRAFPCGVYDPFDPLSLRPYALDEINMVYPTLPTAPATGPTKRAWCEGDGSRAQNALQMLLKFPFDISNPLIYAGNIEILHPLWNQDNKRGWRGPYLIDVEGIRDAWGNYYRLINPELDFAAYDRANIWCDLDPTGSFYVCQDINLGASRLGNSASIVSNGRDGLPNTADDMSVDLLK